MPEESRFKIFSSGRVFFNLPQRAGARACGTGWATDIEKQGEEKNDYFPLNTYIFNNFALFLYIYRAAHRLKKEVERMALAMEYTSGNAKIKIMDDFCSAPDQKERDARILKRVDAIVLAAIRANPEKYYALLKQKEEAREELTATRRKS